MMTKHTTLIACSLIALLLTGCASSSEEMLQAEKEKMRQEREHFNEQHKRAREADYDLQKSTK